MKEYEVSIVETLKKTVTVEAESPEDAKYQVQKAWAKANISLMPTIFRGWNLNCRRTKWICLITK